MADQIVDFSVTPSSVEEGQSVTVRWTCANPEQVSLTVISGDDRSTVQLADSGARMVRVEKPANGRTVFRLSVTSSSGVERQERTVKVKAQKIYRTTKVHSVSSQPFVNKVSVFFMDIWAKIKDFFSRLAYGWASMPEKKRRIWKAVILFCIMLWVASVFQRMGYRMGYEKGVMDSMRIEGRI